MTCFFEVWFVSCAPGFDKTISSDARVLRSDLGNDEAGGKGEGSAGKGQPTGQLSPTGAISHLVTLRMATLALEPKKEKKACGHWCCPATMPLCCACADTRPVLEGDTYPRYRDGSGWTDDGARDDGYCPVCNTKNFDAWQLRVREELAKKAAADDKARAERERVTKAAAEDKARFAAAAIATAAAATTTEGEELNELEGGGELRRTWRKRRRSSSSSSSSSSSERARGRFEYSSGDVYEGEMSVGGEREGTGTMAYEDGTVYEGQWVGGLHEGQGSKTWLGGISYVGEWKNGMMHGNGRYVMEDGYVMEGRFEEDEYCDG